jgi:hypothetical protein
MMDGRAVWCSTKELCGVRRKRCVLSTKELCAVDERSVVSSKQKLCSVRRKRCVVFEERAVWCPTKDQDDHFNVVRLQSSDCGKAVMM